MFGIGKMKPDSRNVGRNARIRTTWNANSCDSATVETSSPVPSAPSRNSVVAARSDPHEPRIGSSNSHIAATMIPIDEISDSPRYGIVLPTM